MSKQKQDIAERIVQAIKIGPTNETAAHWNDGLMEMVHDYEACQWVELAKWTKHPREPGVYVVRHYWEDGTQQGSDYLYRYTTGGKWVTPVGDTDKRIIEWNEHDRMRFFGPIPPIGHLAEEGSA